MDLQDDFDYFRFQAEAGQRYEIAADYDGDSYTHPTPDPRSLEQVDLRVDAGDDRAVSVGQTVGFKATFRTPDDSSGYNVEWGLRRPL